MSHRSLVRTLLRALAHVIKIKKTSNKYIFKSNLGVFFWTQKKKATKTSTVVGFEPKFKQLFMSHNVCNNLLLAICKLININISTQHSICGVKGCFSLCFAGYEVNSMNCHLCNEWVQHISLKVSFNPEDLDYLLQLFFIRVGAKIRTEVHQEHDYTISFLLLFYVLMYIHLLSTRGITLTH